MRQTDDHALAPFRNRRNPGALNAYMSEVERASEQRRQGGKRRRTATDRQLIRLDAPDSCQPGQTVSVRVHHSIPPRLGTQKLHVTLKVGAASKRHERKTVSIEGTGAVTLVFPVPESVPDQTVAFAAFVGEDYSGSLQHVTTRAIPTR